MEIIRKKLKKVAEDGGREGRVNIVIARIMTSVISLVALSKGS